MCNFDQFLNIFIKLNFLKQEILFCEIHDLLKTEETLKGILYGNSDTLKHNSHAINRNV